MKQPRTSRASWPVSRRGFLGACASAGMAGLLRSPGSTAADEPASSITATRSGRRPNLILLVADDQRADSMGCAGNRIIQTPNIDALAAAGTRFRQSFATTAICPCSRATILTGLHTRSHGIYDFDTPLPRSMFDNTYPMLLKRAGYRVGFVGKWGLGGALPTDDYGYFAGFSGQGFYFEPGRTKHLTVLQADQAVDFVRACKTDKPFCLAVSFKAPHVQDDGRNQPGIYPKYPYDRALEPMYQDAAIPVPATKDATPMPAFLDRTLNRTREGQDFRPETYQEAVKSLYRLVSGLDIAVGRIVAAVKDLGVQDNTVIVYTSDHGSLYGEHGFGGKWLMLEESIRGPLIVCDPRVAARLRGAQRDEMVLRNDLLPTLLELAGVHPPPSVQGRSLVPLVYGQRPQWRGEWFYEFPNKIKEPVAASAGIRTDRWKYIRYTDTQPVYEQLFDLQSDPREETDLARQADQPEMLNQLRGRWLLWRTALENYKVGTPWSEPSPELPQGPTRAR